ARDFAHGKPLARIIIEAQRAEFRLLRLQRIGVRQRASFGAVAAQAIKQRTGHIDMQVRPHHAGAQRQCAARGGVRQPHDAMCLRARAGRRRHIGAAVEQLRGVIGAAGLPAVAQVRAVAAGQRNRAIDFHRRPHPRQRVTGLAVVAGQKQRQRDAARAQRQVGRGAVLHVGPFHRRRVLVAQRALRDQLHHRRPVTVEVHASLHAHAAVHRRAPAMAVTGRARTQVVGGKVALVAIAAHHAERAEAAEGPARRIVRVRRGRRLACPGCTAAQHHHGGQTGLPARYEVDGHTTPVNGVHARTLTARGGVWS
ncbi:conserved hypothetical protein, partial [Ricinus communis]